MAKLYTIDHTSPTVYLDKAGKVVNGYQVTVVLTGFDETHLVNVPTLDKTVVKDAITKLLTDRNSLSDLGEEEE
jgi:hypothetical protein